MMALTVHLFGTLEVRVNQVSPTPLASRRTGWLLALLVLRRRAPVEREWLAATLWPDSDTPQALYNLRRALSTLRTALGPDEAGRLVSPTPHTLRLDLRDADCDVCAFDEAMRQGDRESLEAAVSLYRGPLLDGCEELWAVGERRDREEKYLGALETLAEAGMPEAAVRALRHVVAAAPAQASAQRALMAALGKLGDYAAAVQVYRDFRLFLHDSQRSSPDAETTALYESLIAAGRQAGQQALAIQKGTQLPPPPYHLPTPLTTLIGRETEVERIGRLFGSSRLATLTGTGGVGKTRLALAVAHDLLADFPDGVWFADLAPLTAPEVLPATLATVFGLRETPGRSPAEAVAEFLRSRRLLLVLDNCEHVLDAAARLVDALLRSCPQVNVLATSREALGIAGESAYRVPSLSLPDVKQPQTPESLPQYEAVRLFIERATAAKADFAVTRHNAPALASVCHRLDGIPLAIELAAARVRSMTVEELETRLADRFRLLTGGSRTALPRQRTLRALIDWSYDLLDDGQKALLGRLSVFAGGWTLAAAESVCAGEGVEEWEVLDLLTALADKSLVSTDTQAESTRYRLLETVRQYARERLTESGGAAQERHRDYFLKEIEARHTDLAWLGSEQDNLRAGITFSLAAPDGAEAALWLSGCLHHYWWATGEFTEGRAWLEKALERGGGSNSVARMRALNAAAAMAMLQSDNARAEALATECLALANQWSDKGFQSAALTVLGHTVSNSERAQSIWEQQVALHRASGDQAELAHALADLAFNTLGRGDLELARLFLEEAEALAKQSGHDGIMEFVQERMVHIVSAEGDLETARTLTEQGLERQRARNNPQEIGWALGKLAGILGRQGDFSAAKAHLAEAVPLFERTGNAKGLIGFLEIYAQLAADQDQMVQTVRFLGAADRQRELRGLPRPPMEQATHDDDMIPRLRAKVGEAGFAAAWEEGRGMTLEQAVEYALAAGGVVGAS